jgi:ABC-2 type transport system ATP-binding protein
VRPGASPHPGATERPSDPEGKPENVEVTIDHLTKVYEGRITALNDVSLRIGTGVFGLLGPNGSGKTTLMRIIATLLEPTAGSVRVNGFDVRRQKAQVRRILGYMPQDFGLYPSLTAYEVLDYMALLCDLTEPTARKEAIERALAETNLTHLRDRRVGTFSGGMRQRLGIAQALLHSPQLLIVDEPTVGLDPEERIRMRSLLAELGQDRIIILSTHIVADVEAVADQLGVLYQGRVRFQGPPDALLRQLHEKVWLVDVSREELGRLRDRYLETGVFRSASGMQVRVIAEEMDHPHARPVEPNLEDASIWLMKGTQNG